MVRRDPIVEEVRRTRAAIAREHGNDLETIVAALQREEATSSVPTVSFPPKRSVKRTSGPKLRTRVQPDETRQSTSRAAKVRRVSSGRKRAARG